MDEVRLKLKEILNGNITVVGVGNTMMGDDGYGAVLADRVKNKIAAHVINAGTTPENHVREIRDSNPDVILIVDAADFGGVPGELRIFGRKDISLCGLSTHDASLGLFFEFLERQTHATVYMLAVQPGRSILHTPMSGIIERKCDEVESFLVELLPSQKAY